MSGISGRANISPIAALAGPGQPRLTVQSLALLRVASLSGGCRAVRIVVEPAPALEQLRREVGEGREVVELALVARLIVIGEQVEDELLGRVLVLGVGRDLVVEDRVAMGQCPIGTRRALQRRAEEDVGGNVRRFAWAVR